MSDWTIETVDIRRPKDRFLDDEPGGIPPDVVRAIARGRMTDGRPFYYEEWMTEAFLDSVGEEYAKQMIQKAARPLE